VKKKKISQLKSIGAPIVVVDADADVGSLLPRHHVPLHVRLVRRSVATAKLVQARRVERKMYSWGQVCRFRYHIIREVQIIAVAGTFTGTSFVSLESLAVRK
jgi:hypothetical protein